MVVSVTEKVHKMYQVWFNKTNTSESPLKCRNTKWGQNCGVLVAAG